MIFFTSDLHLGHENCIRLCNRPFSSIEEMDETLIENWNYKVTGKDTVYILGDLIYRSQKPPEEYLRRVHLLQANLHAKCVDYRYHESDLSRLEAVMARGDRRVGRALLEAHNLGCRLDGWDEYFDYEKWLEAFRRAGLDPDFYTTRGYGVDEILPWQTINVGVTTNFLLREREKALRSESTPDCRTHCNGCGARRLSERGLCDESPAV